MEGAGDGGEEDWAGLPRGVLEAFSGRVAAGDGLAFRLTCRAFAEAGAPPWWTWARAEEGGEGRARPRALTTTPVRAVAVSAARLEWARGLLGEDWERAIPYVCQRAAGAGSLGALQWARAQGCPWDANTCRGAAEGGHLEVLQWARAQECPWDESICYKAAEGGHLEVLQWARAQGSWWDEDTCCRAAGGGHLEVLQWARAQGCPWDASICYKAAGGGTWRCCSGRGSRGARGTG